MSDRVNKPQLPDSHMQFLKAVADAADKYGMSGFEISYSPRWDTKPINGCRGSIKMIYSNTDGRGRPAQNMRIEYLANFLVEQESEEQT